ncbi:MAG: phage tail tape measure protein [Oscillospiraceae bacterium]|nr:phage tail tape measure protein [Oscillospiraceae bacterium]
MNNAVMEIFVSLGLNKKNFDSGLDQASQQANTFGTKFKKGLKTAGALGAKALGVATTAVVGFGTASVKAGAEFDSSMSQVAATMGDNANKMVTYNGKTVSSMEALRDFAQEMGAKTAFSATEAADALNYMALAGYDAETSMKMLPNVLNLAAAGGIDLASASDMVTDAASALGMTLEDGSVDIAQVTKMVDQMAQASSKSNTSVSQLGEAILTVGGTAKTLSGGTTELSAALGILADNGIKGSEGGTALRNIILSLSTPTDKAAKKMKELGLEVFDAEGNMRPLNDIFNDLNGTLSGMNQGEQLDVLNTLFNKVDLKSANALLGTTNDRWNELTGAIDNAQGAAEKMAETQLDNLQGDITLFKSALEGTKIAISDKLTPSIRDFVKIGSNGLSKITEGLKNGGLDGAMKAIGEVLTDILQTIIKKLPQMVKAGLELIKALVKGIMDNLDLIIDSAFEIIFTLADAILDNIDKIIVAIVDIVLKIAEKLTDPQTIVKLVEATIKLALGIAQGLIKAIPKIVEALPQIIKGLVEGLIQGLPMLIDGAVQLVAMLVVHLPDIILGLIQAIPEIIAAILEAMGPIGEGLMELFSFAWEGVKGVFEGVAGFFGGVWDNIKGAFSTVGSWFSSTFEGAKNLAVSAWDNVKSKFEEKRKLVEAGLETIGSWCQSTFSKAKELAVGAWDNVKADFEQKKTLVQAGFNGIGDWFTTTFTNAKNNATNAWSNIQSLFGGIWDKIKGAFNIGDALQWGKDMIDNFINGIKSMIGAVGDAVKGVANKIKGLIGFSEPEDPQSPLHNFHTFAPDMMQLFAKGVRDNEKMLQDTVADAFDFQNEITANVKGNTSNLSLAGASGGQFVIPIYIGGDKVDEKIISAIDAFNYRSGGRS